MFLLQWFIIFNQILEHRVNGKCRGECEEHLVSGVVDDEGGLEVVVGLGELSVEEVQGSQKVGQRKRHFLIVKLCFQQFYSHVAQLFVGGAVHGEEFEELLLIFKLWAEANKKVAWREEFDEMAFFHSVIDYRKVLNITNQPHYFSHFIVGLLMGKTSLPYAMNYPRKLPKEYRGIDWLNLKHEVWLSPETGEERHESFDDLWKNAEEDYRKAREILKNAEEKKPFKEELHAYIGNVQHDGVSVNGEMRHFSLLPL